MNGAYQFGLIVIELSSIVFLDDLNERVAILPWIIGCERFNDQKKEDVVSSGVANGQFNSVISETSISTILLEHAAQLKDALKACEADDPETLSGILNNTNPYLRDAMFAHVYLNG